MFKLNCNVWQSDVSRTEIYIQDLDFVDTEMNNSFEWKER